MQMTKFLVISDFGTLYREQTLFFLRISEFFQNELGNLWKSFWHDWVPYEKYWHLQDKDNTIVMCVTHKKLTGVIIIISFWVSPCYPRSPDYEEKFWFPVTDLGQICWEFCMWFNWSLDVLNIFVLYIFSNSLNFLFFNFLDVNDTSIRENNTWYW